jgi:aldehyde:ferredoxin oxidoreductase
MLWKESPRGTTAFDPANRLTFAPGPMQGIKQTGAAKWTAGAISPSINLNADSAATASFGIEIKEAGYDAIVVHGRADKPVYVVVDDDKAEIKDANHLWAKDAYEGEDGIKDAEGDKFEVVTIGQAGERLVRYANIQTRKKSFLGRCGLGAVMGSKMLKGIAVRGTQSVPVYDAKEVKWTGSTRRSTSAWCRWTTKRSSGFRSSGLVRPWPRNCLHPRGTSPSRTTNWPPTPKP